MEQQQQATRSIRSNNGMRERESGVLCCELRSSNNGIKKARVPASQRRKQNDGTLLEHRYKISHNDHTLTSGTRSDIKTLYSHDAVTDRWFWIKNLKRLWHPHTQTKNKERLSAALCSLHRVNRVRLC